MGRKEDNISSHSASADHAILASMNLATGNHDIQCHESSSAHRAGTMENLPRVDVDSSLSRLQRLISVQELLLEYSLVIVVLGCFLLVSLPLKLLPKLSACHNEMY